MFSPRQLHPAVARLRVKRAWEIADLSLRFSSASHSLTVWPWASHLSPNLLPFLGVVRRLCHIDILGAFQGWYSGSLNREGERNLYPLTITMPLSSSLWAPSCLLCFSSFPLHLCPLHSVLLILSLPPSSQAMLVLSFSCFCIVLRRQLLGMENEEGKENLSHPRSDDSRFWREWSSSRTFAFSTLAAAVRDSTGQQEAQRLEQSGARARLQPRLFKEAVTISADTCFPAGALKVSPKVRGPTVPVWSICSSSCWMGTKIL